MGDALETHDGQTLQQYEHPEGPEVTHLRGLLLMNALDNLRTWGVYDAYLERLSAQHRSMLTSTIASSWVPIEHALMHYEAVECLDVDPEKVAAAGRRMAEQIGQMYLAPALRAAEKGNGIDVFANVLAHNDKLWERMYRGGGFYACRLGPCQLLLEDRGNPLTRFQIFRAAYVAYMEALAARFRPGVRVVQVPASEADAMTTRFSWA